MKYMTSAEIRESFLSFFEKKGCKRMPSSSLIPDDPSLLLTSAGMVQFKPYFLQKKKLDPKYVGTTTVQKCVRTNDIEIIGTTGRHQSFFEMLGNFSFGEYFKEEMCAWALEFSVEVLGLPKERLYFTVYKDDDESIEIWKNLGIDPSHISRLGEDDNFWRAGPTGPCGPCSELYYDQGESFGCGSPDCGPGCDCDRYLEYWNLVFTQFDGQEDGTLKPLPKKNIDTGMGLERVAAIMQGVQSNYETDILRSLIHVGEKICNVKYGQDSNVDLTLRIVADHSRAVAFMIADGILPGNEGREYVLRRLLRRCVMKVFLLGYDDEFLTYYIDEIIRLMGDVYPEIVENQELIKKVVSSEEERFRLGLKYGLEIITDLLKDAKPTDKISGKDAFILHDTYGFPIEVTKELAKEHNVEIDMEAFEKCMEEQRSRARAANLDETDAAWDTYTGPTAEVYKEFGPTKFMGYDNLHIQSKVLAIISNGERVKELKPGQEGSVFMRSTPFYGEMGGQIGDTGYIYFEDRISARVIDTQIPEKGLYAHVVKVDKGSIKVGMMLDMQVDKTRRSRICRNHTATHILHWALRQVLGNHVKQAGSYVSEERLRFDFTHFEALSQDDIMKVEKLANQKLEEGAKVNVYTTTLKEARKNGVTALFGEKYGEKVRVVEVGDFSKELCGGCHVSNTYEIGMIKITGENSVGANSRRIEAVTSISAYDYVTDLLLKLNKTAEILRTPVGNIVERAKSNVSQIKELEDEVEYAYSKSAKSEIERFLSNVKKTEGGYDILIENVNDLQGIDIREGWDAIRDHLGDNCAVVLGGINKNKPILLAAGTDKAVAAGFNAGKVIKSIVGHIKGGGGGKPTMAQAGGKDTSGLDKAVQAARDMLL